MKSIATTLAGILCLGSICSSAWAHSAIEPQPRPDTGWKQRQESINKRVAEAGSKAQVIFIGDSITQGWEGEGKDVWARYYAPRNAVNLGIGGDRTQHVLWRLDNGNLDGLKPKAAVVMIGTNNSNGEDNTPGQIADGIRAIVEKLRQKLPETKVLLVAIFPRSENYSVQRGKLAQINQVIHRIADGKNVFWSDFGHRFLNDDGTIPRSLMPDYLHLSPAGYTIWAEAIEDRLAGLIGDTKVTAGGVAAAASVNVSGEWVLTIPGPDGNPVNLPLQLKQDGSKLTGRVRRGETDQWLELENGSIDGSAVAWTVKRDRSDGTSMTYKVAGKVENGSLGGKVTTQFNGADTTVDWTAKRK